MTIDKFDGPHRFLSNFWPAKVELDFVEYPTVEHAYQAAKTLDIFYRKQICAAVRPGDAKRLGRKFKQRRNWADVKTEIMLDLLRQKFSHAKLADLLIRTGDQELVEGNYWGDTYWGVCDGVGENHLGKLLMQVRKELQDAQQSEAQEN